MNKKKVLALTCSAILMTGCAFSGEKIESEEDISEVTQATEEATEQSSSEDTSTDSTEANADPSADSASESSTTDKQPAMSSNEFQEVEVINLSPADIPLVNADDIVTDYDLYLQYVGESYSSGIQIDSIRLVNGENVSSTDVYTHLWEENKCVRLATDDGREYIYLELGCDNDYYDLVVFDITNGDSKFVYSDWHVYGGGAPVYNDANNIVMCDRGSCMGSFSYFDTYSVGADGTPTPVSDIAPIDHVSSKRITSIKKMELELVDENGNGTGTTTIVPKGSVFVPIELYKQTQVDARLEDGRVVRIPTDSLDYEATINGKDIREWFNGMEWVG